MSVRVAGMSDVVLDSLHSDGGNGHYGSSERYPTLSTILVGGVIPRRGSARTEEHLDLQNQEIPSLTSHSQTQHEAF